MHKALSLLGIAAKAGRIAGGETATEQAVRSGRAELVILAEDASDNTRKKFTNLCRHFDVPVMVFSDMDSLGRAVGKGVRSNLAVMDRGLADGIRKKIEETQ